MRRPKRIWELEQELLVATRRFLSEGDQWGCKFRDLADMRDIVEELEARELLVRAYVDADRAYCRLVWEGRDYRNATPDELKAIRAVCIENELKQAGIPVDTEPPTDDEIERETTRQAEEYSDSLREWYAFGPTNNHW